MSNRRISIACSLLALVCAVAPAAHADDAPRIAVLTPSSDQSDDTLALAVGDALRAELRARGGFTVSDARISLEQLSMANDCEPDAPACLRKIAKGLAVDGLLYTSISRRQGTSELVDVRYFSLAPAGDHETKRVTHVFVTPQPSAREIEIAGNGLVMDMFGASQSAADPGGHAIAPTVAEPAGEPPAPHEHPSVTESDHAAQVDASGVSTRAVAGYALLGVAAVSAGLSVLSFVQIDSAESDAAFRDYQVAIGKQNPRVKDVCTEAERGETYGLTAGDFASVRDRCSTGGTYEVLQYVFIGATLVSGGAAAYLLLGDDDGSGSERAARAGTFALRPTVSRRGAGIHASLRF
jgi:hypothetical protein